jgi:sugar (pentulose or hexulose) kinase
MKDIVGPHRTLVAAGGWCYSAMVMAAKRAGFGGLTVSDVGEPGALGAAILAARAAGHLGPADVLGASPGEQA